AEQDQILYVVIGIGLNVNQEKIDFPEDIDKKATSIHIETEREWNIHTLIQSILETFEKAYEAYIEKGFPNVKDKWESYGYKMGKSISLKISNEQIRAIFSGIAEDGALIIHTESGERKKLYSAEIDWFQDVKNE